MELVTLGWELIWKFYYFIRRRRLSFNCGEITRSPRAIRHISMVEWEKWTFLKFFLHNFSVFYFSSLKLNGCSTVRAMCCAVYNNSRILHLQSQLYRLIRRHRANVFVYTCVGHKWTRVRYIIQWIAIVIINPVYISFFFLHFFFFFFSSTIRTSLICICMYCVCRIRRWITVNWLLLKLFGCLGWWCLLRFFYG